MPKIVYGSLFIAMMMFGGALRAQDHSEHQTGTPAPSAAAQSDDVAIFCPTMKTGQLCSHGTANNLKVTGTPQEEKWGEFARKYNRAVNTATEQLFKDAETVLTPEQQALLKAWFAVGMNPQINDLLYAKGLGGPQGVTKPPAVSDAKPATAK